MPTRGIAFRLISALATETSLFIPQEKDRTLVRNLALIFLAAFSLRMMLVLGTPVMSQDGVGYIEAISGGVDGAARARLPVYPLLIRIFLIIFDDAQLAGQMVSALSGALYPVLFFLWARRTFPRACFFAAGLAACQPYHLRYSADVLTEPVYFSLLAGIFLLFSSKTTTVRGAGLRGALVGLLALTRPEGGIVAGLSVLFLLIRRREKPRFRWISVAVIVSMIALLLVRLDQLGDTAGSLDRTFRLHLYEIQHGEKPEKIADLDGVDFDLPKIAIKLFHGMTRAPLLLAEGMNPLVFLVSLAGFWLVWRRRRLVIRHRLFLPLVASIVLILFFGAVFPSRRYILQASLPFVLLASEALSRFTRSSRAYGLGLTAFILMACLIKAGVSQRTEKIWLREMGEKVAALASPHRPVIITTSGRIAFYARGIRMNPDDVRAVDGSFDWNRVTELSRKSGDAPVFWISLPGQSCPDPEWLGEAQVIPGGVEDLYCFWLMRSTSAGKIKPAGPRSE